MNVSQVLAYFMNNSGINQTIQAINDTENKYIFFPITSKGTSTNDQSI